MRKIIVLSLVGLLVIVGGIGAYVYFSMGRPMYQPGMVRAGDNLRGPLEPPAQPAGGEFWQVESDIALHYFHSGAGQPVLVVHGGPGFPFDQPAGGFEALADRFTFYYYDQRGCGRSTHPIDRFESKNMYQNMLTAEKTLGLGAQIADIERIRRILGVDKLILVGHSFGGFLASLYAAEFPEHVQALVLVAPADVLAMPSESGGLYEIVGKLLPQEMQGDYQDYLKRYFNFNNLFQMSETDLEGLNAEFVPYYAAALKARGLEAPAYQPGNNGGWMVQAMYISMGQRNDYRPALKAVAAPVLVVHGALDLQPESASRQYAGAFPNARFIVVPDAGHAVFSDQPQLFAEAVGNFLAEVNK